MEHTRIPEAEIELFKQLSSLKVIFDVGARTDIDYLEIWPESEHHLFEPHPKFFEVLKEKVGNKPNVFLNNFGLGDRNEERGYHDNLQSFVGSWILSDGDARDRLLPLRNTASYINEHEINQIDFFKIDTEGFELKVLLGLIHHFGIIRFLQYEHSGKHNNDCIKGLLHDNFEIYDVGYRNSFCISKSLVHEGERDRLAKYIRDNNLSQLA